MGVGSPEGISGGGRGGEGLFSWETEREGNLYTVATITSIHLYILHHALHCGLITILFQVVDL